MNARKGRKRLFVTLFVVVVLLAGGVAGMFYFSQARQAASATPDATAAARSSQAGEVVLASDRGQSGSDSAEAETDEAAAEEGEEGEEKEKKSAIPVSVTPIRIGRVSSYITSTANLVAEDTVEILAEAEGRIDQLRIEEGDRVRRGQVLASLVRDDAEIALRKAKLKAMNAQMA